MKYTNKSKLAEVLKHPKADKILSKYSVPCIMCPMAQLEMDVLTIGEIAERYELDIKNLLKELNDRQK